MPWHLADTYKYGTALWTYNGRLPRQQRQ